MTVGTVMGGGGQWWTVENEMERKAFLINLRLRAFLMKPNF